MRNVPSQELRTLFAVAIGIQLVATAPAKSETFVYRKICDATAAVAIDADRFVVADDERNTLRIYRRDLADPLDEGGVDLSEADAKPLSIFLPDNLNPEAIFEIKGTGKVQVLSDDGKVEADGVRCKDRNDSEKKFRSIVLDIDGE